MLLRLQTTWGTTGVVVQHGTVIRSAPFLAKWRGKSIMALEGHCHRTIGWRLREVRRWLEPGAV